MYNVKCLNPIAQIGLDNFTDEFQMTEEINEAEAVLVRSASMHEIEAPEKLLAVARAGATGGKLLGAGGSGFFLFYVPEEKKKYLEKK